MIGAPYGASAGRRHRAGLRRCTAVAIITSIDDPSDPRADDYRDLTTADRRPDRPGGRGLVIGEGVVVVRRMIESPYPLRSLFGVPRRLAELAPDLAASDVPAYSTDAATMAQVVGFHLNRGVLAVADRAVRPDPAELVRDARLVAVLEGVNDHENLGALFRNAAALGVDAVLLGPRCSDPLYRRSVRVSMGHVLRVPFADLPGPWPASLELLRAAGLRVAALTPAVDAVPLAGSALSGERVALLLGAEGPGLTAETLAAADVRVRIPMATGVDSLNVATAAAVAFHAVRAPH
jgi:tRNA G18 (ribose-2'-O)-methylase SpoU